MKRGELPSGKELPFPGFTQALLPREEEEEEEGKKERCGLGRSPPSGSC